MKRLFLLLLSCNVFAVTTPNMLLSSPVVGDTNYPTQITTSLSLIDAHDHTTGKGVQVGSGGLAAGSVVASTIGTSAVTTVKIQDTAVTTAKITDLNVTTAKINALAVTTAKINDLAVTTGKIADLAVTQGKRAALGQQLSSGSGTFSTTSSSFVDVTNLTVTITTTGRPVFLSLGGAATGTIPGPSAGCSHGSSDTAICKFAYLRDASPSVGENTVTARALGATAVKNFIPCSSFSHIDVVAAGTYTYKFQAAAVGSGSAAEVSECKLTAYEL